MNAAETLKRGRDSFARQEWGQAYALLASADSESTLEFEDLERLATAAYLVGNDSDSADVWMRAHQELLSRGDVPRAVRCAFWLAFALLNRGERARGSGWIARARRLLDDGDHDCVEQGYLLLPVAMQSIMQGDAGSAYATFCRVAEIASRFGDPDLVALALHSRGRALIRLGEIDEGVMLLDEAMAAIEAGDVSPLVVGDVYCSVIEGCLEIFDLRRAHEWTDALTHWCESQPDLVPHTGQCLVRRAELMQLHGEWRSAHAAAQSACQRLLHGSDRGATGAAFYQQAELHRLRGEFAEAEAAYREAGRWGRALEPGLAQLRLAQGRPAEAAAAIRRAVNESHDRATRCRLLAARVDIMLAVGDIESARAGADELARFAGELNAPLLRAGACHARGAVHLAEGDARAALASLRDALSTWQEIEAPYAAARTRTLLALACRELGDEDGARLELEEAQRIFRELGAAPDLANLELLASPTSPSPAGRLTAREVQVLRLLATGMTNRAIAADLEISEKTVARHVSNIFMKLELSSRAAATAYAYEHGLV